MTREPVWLLDKLSAISFVAMVVTGALWSPLFNRLTTTVVILRLWLLCKLYLKAHLHPRLIAVVCLCFESLYCPNA